MQRTIDQCRYLEKPPDLSINSVAGVLANYAEDLQLFLEIMNGAIDDQWSVEPLKDFRQIEVSKLKVGYFLTDGLFEPMPAVKRAILESVDKLKAIGVELLMYSRF